MVDHLKDLYLNKSMMEVPYVFYDSIVWIAYISLYYRTGRLFLTAILFNDYKANFLDFAIRNLGDSIKYVSRNQFTITNPSRIKHTTLQL